MAIGGKHVSAFFIPATDCNINAFYKYWKDYDDDKKEKKSNQLCGICSCLRCHYHRRNMLQKLF